jgi:glycosyltransferase involved in cell wall biosynthesis
MSEHEGFGVPLVEAMYFGVPIVAHAAAAIPETLGGSGVLLPKSDSADEEYMLAAEVIHELVCNEEFRCCVVDGQKERLKDFKYERITKQMIQSIDRLVK